MKPGHVKRDPATGAVAIRTDILDSDIPQLQDMEWLIAHRNGKAKAVNTSEVESWVDLFIPEGDA